MQRLHHSSLFKQAVFVNGEWVPADSGKTLPVTNPFDGEVLGHVPDCAQPDTLRAIHAARHAYPTWRALSALERSRLLWAWADLVDKHKDDLATIMTLEQGKPLEESLGEINYANSFIKWFAEEGRRAYGDIIPANQANRRLLVLKQPIGVSAAITPWNFPAAMITRKVAPALAVGCTMVLKPASETPFSALALAVLAQEAGLPHGVLNILTGNAEVIAAEMTSNPEVRKLSFTGSTHVGRLLMKQCAPTIKKLSLELGGNAPFIVFDDADLDAAVLGAMACKFRNSGQTCVCANRIYVHDKIYAEFSQRLLHAVKRLRLGNGLESGVQIGPLISPAALQKVRALVDDARQKGAQLLCGGQQPALGGLFYEPTVLTNMSASMRLAKEEAFGPVAPLFRFHHEAEVIEMANHSEYGLAGYFYSQNIDRIWRVAEALEVGMVGINTGILSTEVAPFGGVKQSGIGREGSRYGLDEYLEMKYLCMGLGD